MPKHYRPAGKKKEGNAALYTTRTRAVKQLQVSLPLFRKLCILKGVFPRVPKKKLKGSQQTYYHVKDISFLQHDPLLPKFREISAYKKKVKKALGKKNRDLAQRLLTREPTYTLDRLIKERYPRFIDALRDLDDCLCMVHLFAALPAVEREKVEVKRIRNCRRLSHEWQAYISRTHRLRKTFISVKGIYYQAEVNGQKITWLTPHFMQQVLTNDVDFRVMLTFLEFYETLLGFINFKLYHSIGVKYPPILDPRLEALAADLYALARYMDAESELRPAQFHHHLPLSEPGVLMNLVKNSENGDEDEEEDEETKACKGLFKGMTFFLSREVPKESLVFVIPSFGGMVSWEGEGAPLEESDEVITYQIVDRPTQGHLYLSRVYVQPQWIYDCVNALLLLPAEKYSVGSVPPPHLSPFVDDEEEGYIPEYAETIKRLQAAAQKEILPLPAFAGEEESLDPHNLLLVEGMISRAEASEAAERKRKMGELEQTYYDELKKEMEGIEYVPPSKNVQDVIDEEDEPAPHIDQIHSDHARMSTSVMSRKKRKIYEAIQIGRQRKRAGVELLKQRKKKVDSVKDVLKNNA